MHKVSFSMRNVQNHQDIFNTVHVQHFVQSQIQPLDMCTCMQVHVPVNEFFKNMYHDSCFVDQ